MTGIAAQGHSQMVGWHGKLPTVGDFATRRLDNDFVTVWDDWLSQGLATLRRRDEVNWLADYLASPTWRFLTTPGFFQSPLQNQAWAGVVMPSVDRVGRYYPLTLATVLPTLPTESTGQAALWTWLHRLEDAAVDALQEDWSIDALEAELMRVGLPTWVDLPQDPADILSLLSSQPVASVAPPPSAAEFFSVCSAPDVAAGAWVGGRCMWYSEAGLATPKNLLSTSRDNSILGLWQA